MDITIKERIEIVKSKLVPVGYSKSSFGVRPSTWRIFRLNSAIKKVGNAVEVIQDQEYVQIGIRSHAKGIFYKDTVRGNELRNKKVFWIEQGCFVVNIVFAWELAVAKTTVKEIGMIASHRFPMYRPVNNKVDLEYLLYFFMTKQGLEILQEASPGGAGRNKTLGQKDFLESQVMFPPYDEQQKIAKVITHCEHVILLKKQAIIEERKKMTWLQKAIFTNNDSYKSLASVCKVIMGQSPKSSTYNTCGDGVPLVQGNADIKNRRINASSFTSSPTKLCDKGDILLSVRAPVGKVALATVNACIGRGMCAIKPLMHSEYVYQFLLYYENRWGSVAQGSTFEAINGDDIASIKIPWNDRVLKLSWGLAEQHHKINLMERDIDQWELKKKSLIQLLLTGLVMVNR